MIPDMPITPELIIILIIVVFTATFVISTLVQVLWALYKHYFGNNQK